MAFNIDQTIDDMLAAIAGVVTGEWPKVEACARKALKDEKDAIEQIAQARISGEINDDDMKSQLDDEKEALKAALLVCQIKAKVMAQKAANAAIDALKTAIEAALRAI